MKLKLISSPLLLLLEEPFLDSNTSIKHAHESMIIRKKIIKNPLLQKYQKLKDSGWYLS